MNLECCRTVSIFKAVQDQLKAQKKAKVHWGILQKSVVKKKIIKKKKNLNNNN
jgi:hypothetical protein